MSRQDIVVPQTRIVCDDWKRKGKLGLGGRRSSIIPAKMEEMRIIRLFPLFVTATVSFAVFCDTVYLYF